MADDPKPLSEDELKLLGAQSRVGGLSSIDCRRLVADNMRLRQNLDVAIDVERARLEAAEKKVYAMIATEEAALAYREAQGRYSVLQELKAKADRG
ncbi:MAG: hypothetical protein DMF82_00485 [Acidobacteria bacterium]|nr:MAG: hypothetical protein DMF82_00485 [Acidobacteriota bacterium]